MIRCCEYDSPIGKMILAASETALVGAWFVGQKHFGAGLTMVPGDHELLSRARQWLDRYFRGENPDPGALPLEPAGTPFQEAVWELIREVPYCGCTTYGDISASLERRGWKACPRAVGSAVGRNPISIFIPCHRILGIGDRLTGYAGGLEKKVFLLELEGLI